MPTTSFLETLRAESSAAEFHAKICEETPNLKRDVESGLRQYLEKEQARGVFAEFPDALFTFTRDSIVEWLSSEHLDRYTRLGLVRAIDDGRWEDLCSAHRDRVKFGTAGPRQMAALTHDELVSLRDDGFRAEILKGPNTINNVTIALLTTGVARFCRRAGKRRVSITYDSRVFGRGFADFVAAIFLRELDANAEVFVFDRSSPMPEMSYSVAYLRADLGILISASHNPERYNGYKVATETGAQLDPAMRKEVERAIYGDGEGSPGVTLADVSEILALSASMTEADPLSELDRNPADAGALLGPEAKVDAHRLVILGTEARSLEENGFASRDIHGPHAAHVASHVLRRPEEELSVIHSAFYGNGEAALTNGMQAIGLAAPRTVDEYARLDGIFPRFSGNEPKPLIPDPGNSAGHAHAWALVLRDFVEQSGGLHEAFAGVDLLVGTDPDADRLGVVSPIRVDEVPESTKDRDVQLIPFVVPEEDVDAVGFGGLRLLSANDAWTLIVAYRIEQFSKKLAAGELPEGLRFNIVKTHVTTDALARLADYARGLSPALEIEIIEPSVGFSLVAEKIRDGWERGSINLGGAEESGGFSIGGAPPIFFTLLRLFETDGDFSIATDTLDASAESPILRVDDGSYFAYSTSEVREAIEYLVESEILVASEGRATLATRIAELREDHESYWSGLRPFAAGAPGERLGKRGHTMEKDGLLAAVLALEVAAVAKSEGSTLDAYLRQRIYENPAIGYFSTTNQALEFPNTVAGTQNKIAVLRRALGVASSICAGDTLELAGQAVTDVEIFIPDSPKYADPKNFPISDFESLIGALSTLGRSPDSEAPPSFFPEEGIRLHFGRGSGCHLTIRPSGTENKLRFYVQWCASTLEEGGGSLTARMLACDRTAFDIAKAAQALVGDA